MSETTTTTTSQKSIAIHLQFVLQYASTLYCSTFCAPYAPRKGKYSQCSSHLYCSTAPICIAALFGKSWWLWSPGCSAKTRDTQNNSRRKFFSGTENKHKPKLLSPDIFRWGRGLSHEGGGGQKVRYVPRNQGNETFWAGYPGFCRDILAVPEKFEKKSQCSIFVPYFPLIPSFSCNPLHIEKSHLESRNFMCN